MLLTDCQDPAELLRSDDWYMEEKLDGDRAVLEKRGDVIRGFTRHGNEMKLSDHCIAVGMLSDGDFDIDGEMMPGGFFVHWTARGEHHFPQVRRAHGREDKTALFNAIHREKLEGVVFKRNIHGYREGARTEDWQRWKFILSDNFLVTGIDLAKCSAELSLNGSPCGRVACSMSTLPKVGDTIRVRYDRLTAAGKLLRPRLAKS